MKTRLAIALCALALAAGCSLDSSESDAASTVVCESSDECPTGNTCTEYGYCQPDTPLEYEIALEINPPSFRSDLSTQVALGVPVTVGQPVADFRLSRPITLNADVLYNDAEGVTSVDANVRIRSTIGLPGREFSQTVQTDENGTILVELPPGIYDLTIIPDDPSVPRAIRRDIVVAPPSETCATPGGACEITRRFTLPAPEDYVTVLGVVERLPEFQKVVGATIFAVSEDGDFESTYAVTSESGSFDVALDPAGETFEFRLRPTDGVSLPDLRFESISLPDEIEGSIELRLQMGRWLDPVMVPVEVVGPDGRAISNVVVSANAGWEAGDPVADAINAASGEFEQVLDVGASSDSSTPSALLLPPGRYDVSAGGRDGEYGITEAITLVVPDPADGEEAPTARIALPGRSPVRGLVASGASEIAGASVEFSLIGIDGDEPGFFDSISGLYGTTTTTDGRGAFEVNLVPGEYAVTVQPPSGSGLARYNGEFFVAEGGNNDLAVELRPPAPVIGRVLDSDGAPLQGATVEAWVVEDGRAIMLGRATTGEDGSYRLLLPVD